MPEVAEIAYFCKEINEIAKGRTWTRMETSLSAAQSKHAKGELKASFRGKEMIIEWFMREEDGVCTGTGWILHHGLFGTTKVVPQGHPHLARAKALWRSNDNMYVMSTAGTIESATSFDKQRRGPCVLSQYGAFAAHVKREAQNPRVGNMPLADCLLNQKLFNGIGNYLRAEILYRARLDPAAKLGPAVLTDSSDTLLRLCHNVPREVFEQNLNKYSDDRQVVARFKAWLQCYQKKSVTTDKRKLHYDPAVQTNTVPPPVSFPHDDAWRDAFPNNPTQANAQGSQNQNQNQNQNHAIAFGGGGSGEPSTASTTSGTNHHNDVPGTGIGTGVWTASDTGTWAQALAPLFSKPYMATIEAAYTSRVKRGVTMFPPKDEVFNAFLACPLDKVRVVILGQDPYINQGQANGLCFSVRKGVTVPPSLRNMFKELENTVPGFKTPKHGDLTGWANQGILLLNSVLTVETGKAFSMSKVGWQEFTTDVLRYLNDNKHGLVVMLWGAPSIKKGAIINKERHHVLEAPHPSPLSASRGFFGCDHFRKCNAALTADGNIPIRWDAFDKEDIAPLAAAASTTTKPALLSLAEHGTNGIVVTTKNIPDMPRTLSKPLFNTTISFRQPDEEEEADPVPGQYIPRGDFLLRAKHAAAAWIDAAEEEQANAIRATVLARALRRKPRGDLF